MFQDLATGLDHLHGDELTNPKSVMCHRFVVDNPFLILIFMEEEEEGGGSL